MNFIPNEINRIICGLLLKRYKNLHQPFIYSITARALPIHRVQNHQLSFAFVQYYAVQTDLMLICALTEISADVVVGWKILWSGCQKMLSIVEKLLVDRSIFETIYDGRCEGFGISGGWEPAWRYFLENLYKLNRKTRLLCFKFNCTKIWIDITNAMWLMISFILAKS